MVVEVLYHYRLVNRFRALVNHIFSSTVQARRKSHESAAYTSKTLDV